MKKRYKLEKQVNDMENQIDAHSLDILTTARLATVLHNSQTWKETFESKTQVLLVPTTSIPQAGFLANVKAVEEMVNMNRENIHC